MYMLITGQSGTGRHYYNVAEAEKYAIERDRCVYNFPIKDFEIKLAKDIQLNRLANTRKSGIYQIIVPDTHDKVEQMRRYVAKIKNSLIIIPACNQYLDLIQIALNLKDIYDNDVMFVRDTVKDYGKITAIKPDVYRIHADTHLPIQKVYASELANEIGDINALAFLVAQWIVNLQQLANQQADENMYHLGFFLYVIDGKIITQRDNAEDTANLREFILEEGVILMRTRFGLDLPDDQLRNQLINLLD